MTQLRRAAIVAPIRTPVGKFGGALSSMTAGQLGAVILKALVERTKIDPSRVDDVVFSQGYGNGEAPCIGHWSWLLAGLPEEVPGYQLDRRCGSGLQAIINAAAQWAHPPTPPADLDPVAMLEEHLAVGPGARGAACADKACLHDEVAAVVHLGDDAVGVVPPGFESIKSRVSPTREALQGLGACV